MATITQGKPSNPSPILPAFPGAAVAITKSDADVYLEGVTVYVGTTGNVAIVPFNDPAGSAVVFVGVPAGSCVPCRAYKVMSTSTTASDMVGIY